jgi:hypothetical protein
MMFLSTIYYVWLAYPLAGRTGRSDACPLHLGVSVPHMFLVKFVIMLPTLAKPGDPINGPRQASDALLPIGDRRDGVEGRPNNWQRSGRFAQLVDFGIGIQCASCSLTGTTSWG